MSGSADGYLLLRKSIGETSFEALAKVKKAFSTSRVGHAGTLDRFAEGLLVVLIGRSTRLVPWFSGCDKLYEGTLSFGVETDTLDPEGSIIAEAAPPSRERLETALSHFVGDIQQAPPIFSSVHIDGRRAHELARAGVDVDMKARPVSIHSLELLSYDGVSARIRVSCSKGTYIRSLARDIAIDADSRAHLSALSRLSVAGFKLQDAVDPLSFSDPKEAMGSSLKSVDRETFKALDSSAIVVPDGAARKIVNGQGPDSSWFSAVDLDLIKRPFVGLFDESGLFLAVVERKNNRWVYGYVSARPDSL